MLHQTSKEKKAIRQSVERKRSRTEVISRKVDDWKSRQAKADFSRPAYFGTLLQSRGGESDD